MKKEIIKEILKKNLKTISNDDFNGKIIQQLDLSKNNEKPVLFGQKSMIRVFLVISLLILIVNSISIGKLPLQTLIIGITICISPFYFMIFNKIYKASIQNY